MISSQTQQELSQCTSEELIGRSVSFVLRPTVIGQITAVHLFAAGRTITVAYWEGDEARSQDCDWYQLQLCED